MENPSLKARTAAEHLSTQIRDEILAGEYAPGTQLFEVSLSERYGVSRNTLREAYRFLMDIGLLIHFPNRGVFVRDFSIKDIEDLYAFRRICEIASLQEVMSKDAAIESCLTEMRIACATATEALLDEDWNAVAIADSDFHMAIFTATGIERMIRVGYTILAQFRLVFFANLYEHRVYQPFIKLDHQLMELIQARKARESSTLLNNYLLKSQHIVMQSLV